MLETCREAKTCETRKKNEMTVAEKTLLTVDPVHLVSESNKDEQQRTVSVHAPGFYFYLFLYFLYFLYIYVL